MKYDCSPSIILDKLKKYKIERRNASESNTIYPKKSFDGNKVKKAYMIGFRLGDLNAKKCEGNSSLIRIKSSTTKLAQVKLIKDIFGCYGHFYAKKIRGVYRVECSLHKSFNFLLPKKDKVEDWILKNNRLFFAFLAGYTDAEGCIKLSQNRARYRVGSYDKNLLNQAYKKLKELNLYPRYRLETKAGTTYSGVKHNGDFWGIIISNKLALLKLFEFLEPHMHHSSKLKDLKRAKENIIRRNINFGIKGAKIYEYENILCHYPDLLYKLKTNSG